MNESVVWVTSPRIDDITFDEIAELCKLCNNEFVPPLSHRYKTTQMSYAGSKPNDNVLEYIDSMRDFHFVYAVDNGDVIGFLSYKPDQEFNGKKGDYICCCIINPKYRNRHIATGLFQLLPSRVAGNKMLFGKTWSTNKASAALYTHAGFALDSILKDDRGEGVDTHYYVKN